MLPLLIFWKIPAENLLYAIASDVMFHKEYPSTTDDQADWYTW